MLLGLLLALSIAGQAQAQDPQDVTVRQINEYPQATIDELDAAGAGVDPGRLAELMVPTLANQSVRFTAVVLSNPRTSGLGNPDANGFPSRIHVYVRDTSAASLGNEGMGIQLVDGAYQTTGLLNAAIGDVITVVGIPATFTGSGGASMQLEPTSIELLGPYTDFANLSDAILDPEPLASTADANKSVGSNGEVQTNWANLNSLNGQYVRLEGATVQVRDLASDPRPNWLITTDGGTTVLNFYDMSLNYRNDRDGGYNESEFNVSSEDFVPPPPGATINLQGFIVFQGDDPFSRGMPNGALLSIVPFEKADLEVTESPPEASTPSKPDFVPTDADAITVTSTVSVDPSRTLTSVVLTYFTSVDQTEQTVSMTDNGDGTFSATIPAQDDGTFVIYSATATDNTGAEFTSRPQEYRVLNGGITQISHIQEVSGFATDASPVAGLTLDMSLSVTVMTEPGVSGLVAIQDDASLIPWTGIILRTEGTLTTDLQRGDVILVTRARIEESFGLTRLRDVVYTDAGTGGQFGYKTVTTDALQDRDIAEAHEGMMLRFDDVTVVTPQADAPSDFGEFRVGSAGDAVGVRVDDASSAISSQLNETLTEGQELAFIQGLWSFSFSNHKLLPETQADFPDGFPPVNVAVEDAEVPGAFALAQNYPNPFNPVTTIGYELAATGPVRLEVFDMLGRRVAVLVEQTLPAGVYEARFDAADLASGLYLYRLTAGKQVQTRKMLLLK